jgi:hypothetical protein
MGVSVAARNSSPMLSPFVPAQAGTQSYLLKLFDLLLWVPACAGTNGGEAVLRYQGCCTSNAAIASTMLDAIGSAEFP